LSPDLSETTEGENIMKKSKGPEMVPGLPISKGKKAPKMKGASGGSRHGTAPVPDKKGRVSGRSVDATPPGHKTTKHKAKKPPRAMVMGRKQKGGKPAGPDVFGMDFKR
jgi:hypothetical protein